MKTCWATPTPEGEIDEEFSYPFIITSEPVTEDVSEGTSVTVFEVIFSMASMKISATIEIPRKR